MKFALGRAAALIVAASVMFGAGACGNSGDDSATPGAPSTTSSKAPESKDVLLGSLSEYDKGVYAVEFSGLDGSGQATVDAPKKQAYVKTISTDPDAKFAMELLVIEPDAYVKMDMGDLAKLPGMQQLNGKTWMHVDRTKVKDDGSVIVKIGEADLLDLKSLLQSAQSVQPAGDHKYSGTLDLAKGENSPMTDEAVVKALGEKAGSVPFTATLDADGHFTELLIDVPAAGDKKAHQLKLTLSKYGTATVPAKPTGKAVIEAPAKAYDILNG
ncbi:hypothetical protein ABT297_34590 [Dactylosporangium sp. NPDC000555]|uniref:hypothetical protein n=1 Tax=Dactylosporangium sp. NPDC000555 TaxID=3154260 RepID=UPI003329DED5